MFNKLKQFKDLRSRAKHLQDALNKESSEGSANWGKIRVNMNGNQQVTSVSIDSTMMSDRAKLEEGIKDATNDAIQKIQKILSSKMKDLGGLDLAHDMGDLIKK